MDSEQKIKEQLLSQPFFKGKIMTGSMIPVININDEILVEVKANNLKRFDIIVFYQNGRLICHYLWSMNKFVQPLLMQTRSLDGAKDFPIPEEDYIGKVLSHRLSFWRRLKILFK